MPLKVFPKAIEQDFGEFTFPGVFVYRDGVIKKLGINTLTVPRGGVGYAQVAIHGPDSDPDGPIAQFTTDADDYPLLTILPWSHDNIELLFDAYYDGSFRSSDAGSNFSIRKNADTLKFLSDSSVAQGAAITFIENMRLSASGVVFNENGRAPLDLRAEGDTINDVFKVDAGNNQLIAGGFLNISLGPTLTISGGEITVTQSSHRVDTENGDPADDLVTINGGNTDDILLLKSFQNTKDTTLKDNTGNLRLEGDFTLSNIADRIALQKTGSLWYELFRSNNA